MGGARIEDMWIGGLSAFADADDPREEWPLEVNQLLLSSLQGSTAVLPAPGRLDPTHSGSWAARRSPSRRWCASTASLCGGSKASGNQNLTSQKKHTCGTFSFERQQCLQGECKRMDEKRIAELRKFISTVTDPKISAFIDLKKLCQSGIYNLSVQMATEHAAKHGDFNYLNYLLTLVEGSVHATDLISSLRHKLNFVLTETKPRKFKKATPEQVAKAAKQVLSKSIAVETAAAKPPKKAGKPKVSHDLMDSRLMLPGSYGHGKRR